jgi:hypothetical protein
MRLLIKALVALLVLATGTIAGPASAQASRTWVSGVGDDANACSRTAPCKTFTGAIAKTAEGGEIDCLDPGGYGSVTITKSIAIVCDDTLGGITASSGGTGILVNAQPDDLVLLSGLDLNGGSTGAIGIRVMAAQGVVIRDTIVAGFGERGISAEGKARVLLDGCTVIHNKVGVYGSVDSDDTVVAQNETDFELGS